MVLAPIDAAVNESQSNCARSFSLTRLDLTDFRNFSRLRLETDSRPVVLVGKNGVGKTNILEAISCLSYGRGLRRARLFEMAKHTPKLEKKWAVAANIQGLYGLVSLGVGWSNNENLIESRNKRDFRVNGSSVNSHNILNEHISIVWMTPAQDRLFSDSPSGRRHFIDQLVSAFDINHITRIKEFERGRRDRMRILRSNILDKNWLDAIEQGMAERAVAIAAGRLDIVSRLHDEVISIDSKFPCPGVGINGLVEDWLRDMPALNAEEMYKKQLAEDRSRDRETGGSVGPHLSDLTATFNREGVPASQASTGEQKAILIAILLAHSRLLAQLRGAPPIMLLDEVVAHLDSNRRESLFECLLKMGTQAWMTGTDLEFFSGLSNNARYLRVDKSTIKEE